MVGGKLAENQTTKALYANEVTCGNHIVFKIRDDGQGPVAGRFASLWKNGGTHFCGWGSQLKPENQ
jgi:hypothetical protein